MTEKLSTAEAARRLDISRDTLLRWFREGRIRPVARDARGWRCFDEQDLTRIRREMALDRTPDAGGVPNEDVSLADRKPARLIQYLGSKLRSLNAIVPLLKSYTPRGGTCLDLFAGTTVVGQALLDHCSVFSNDCLTFTKVLGDVLIGGVDSSKDLPLPTIADLAETVEYRNNYETLVDVYGEAVDVERTIVGSGIGHDFGILSEELPRPWDTSELRANLRYKRISRFLSGARQQRPTLNSQPAHLFTSYYGGNYFGVHQAIELDSFRYCIERNRNTGRITEWQAKALLASLIAACSKSVSSAGKHFAQPLIVAGAEQRPFAVKRTVADRLVHIQDEMAAALDIITERAVIPRYQSKSFLVDFCSLSDNRTGNNITPFRRAFGVDRVDTIYADPPYTAQQYSRFYHILETLVLYDYPGVQTNPQTGKVTQGLYRSTRHKSPFCSSTQAPEAFERLFQIASEACDHLVLSYSETSNLSGNPRMIPFENLLTLAKRYGSQVEETTFTHRYRKLNKSVSNRDATDSEVMLTVHFR